MAGSVNVIGVEILVSGISAAVSFFEDVLEMEVAYRGPAGGVPGETAVIDGGNIAITLLDAADHGDSLLIERAPRITQLIFGVDGDTAADRIAHIRSSGLVVRSTDDGRAYVPPEVAAGIVGFDLALMFSVVDP